MRGIESEMEVLRKGIKAGINEGCNKEIKNKRA
jgi:hypothetical protein